MNKQLIQNSLKESLKIVGIFLVIKLLDFLITDHDNHYTLIDHFFRTRYIGYFFIIFGLHLGYTQYKNKK